MSGQVNHCLIREFPQTTLNQTICGYLVTIMLSGLMLGTCQALNSAVFLLAETCDNIVSQIQQNVKAHSHRFAFYSSYSHFHRGACIDVYLSDGHL